MTRIKNFDRSARREAARAQEALRTIVADSTAPRDPRARGEHYRRHLADANRVIDTLQVRIAELEAELQKTKSDAEYDLSLCVTRTAAEEARQGAYRLAIARAVDIIEGPEHVPCDLSEEIHKLPNPKPKWTK